MLVVAFVIAAVVGLRMLRTRGGCVSGDARRRWGQASMFAGVACLGLVLTALPVPAQAEAAPTVILTPTSGPILTVITVTSDCGGRGGWLTIKMVADSDPSIILIHAGFDPSNGDVVFEVPYNDFAQNRVQPGDYNVLVTCTTYNDAGESTELAYSPAPFTVTGQPAETNPPVLHLPDDITVPAVDGHGAPVTYEATAEDESGAVDVSCWLASGSVFPTGTTTVRCTATDRFQNQGVGTFMVTVDGSNLPAATYTVTDLGPADATYGIGYGINSVGDSVVHGQVPPSGSPYGVYVMASTGGTTRLPDLKTRESSRPWAINSSRAVVGQSAGRAVVWEGAGVVDLAQGIARDISDNGTVVGSTYGGGERPFAKSAAGALVLLELGDADVGGAWGVNEAGQIVGDVLSFEDNRRVAVRWTGGVAEQIAIPDSSGLYGRDVAEDGAVLITSNITSTGYVWNGTKPVVEVTRPPGTDTIYPERLNDAHQVVGQARGEFHTAFLFTPGSGSIDLQNAIPPATGWNLHVAYDLNNAGQIVGYGSHNGVLRAFRLDPITTSGKESAAPTVTITSPEDNAYLTNGETVTAQWSCTDASPVRVCSGTLNGVAIANGARLDTMTAGTYTLRVLGKDEHGNSATSEVVFDVLAPGDVNTSISGGETVSSGTASTSTPVVVSIVVPDGVPADSTLTVDTQPAGASPTGYQLFGQELVIHGPAATGEPYEVTFTVDSSALGDVAPADVQVFRDGAALLDCGDPAVGAVDPCVVSRSDQNGDAVISVRTFAFSTWVLGRLDYDLNGPQAPVAAAPTVNTAKAGSAIPVKFKLGGNRGLDVLTAGSPTSTAFKCSKASKTNAVQGAGTASSLTYDAASQTYTYTWKTSIEMKGCRDLVLSFRDGTSLRTLYSLR